MVFDLLWFVTAKTLFWLSYNNPIRFLKIVHWVLLFCILFDDPLVYVFHFITKANLCFSVMVSSLVVNQMSGFLRLLRFLKRFYVDIKPCASFLKLSLSNMVYAENNVTIQDMKQALLSHQSRGHSIKKTTNETCPASLFSGDVIIKFNNQCRERRGKQYYCTVDASKYFMNGMSSGFLPTSRSARR